MVLATLLAEVHEPLQPSGYTALRALCEVSQVAKRLGTSLIFVRRHGVRLRFSDAKHNRARAASQHDRANPSRQRCFAKARPQTRPSIALSVRPIAVGCLRYAAGPVPLPATVVNEPTGRGLSNGGGPFGLEINPIMSNHLIVRVSESMMRFKRAPGFQHLDCLRVHSITRQKWAR